VDQLNVLEQQSLTSCLSKAQQAKYDWIDHEEVVTKQAAECRCQKIKVGAVPWCPQVMHSILKNVFEGSSETNQWRSDWNFGSVVPCKKGWVTA